MREYYVENQDEKKSLTRTWRRKNLSNVRERDRNRYERDKEKRITLVESHGHIRRARQANVPFTKGITRGALRKRDGDECTYCGIAMNFKRASGRVFSGADATIEHRVPLARGGEHVWENVVLACRECNLSKGAKTEKAFQEFRNDVASFTIAEPETSTS